MEESDRLSVSIHCMAISRRNVAHLHSSSARSIRATAVSLCAILLALTLGATASRSVTATEPSSCVPGVDRIAAPDLLPLGSTTTVTATVSIECPDTAVPLDIALVIDRSPSMKGLPLEDARTAATTFVARTDLERTRIAIVSFSDSGVVEAELSHDERYLRSAIGSLDVPITGGTDIAAGLRVAGKVLEGERGRGEAPDVIVLLSDARNGHGELPVEQQARILAESGTHIITIALGIAANVSLMESIATTPDDAYVSGDSSVLESIFERIAIELMSVGAHDVQLVDETLPELPFVAGSSRPPAGFDGRVINWRLGILGLEPKRFSIRLRPTRVGRLASSGAVALTWVDSLGRIGSTRLPIPDIVVYDPSAPPTNTPTNSPASPTATPTAFRTVGLPTENPPMTPTSASGTSTPEARVTPGETRSPEDLRFLYLPFASRSGCVRSLVPTDIMLVIDSSTTMDHALPEGRTRLEGARESAAVFAKRAIEHGGRVGLVTFDVDARVIFEPTADEFKIERGLSTIVTQRGSRLDLGISVAGEAIGLARRDSHRQALVLLTDGRVDGATDAAVVESSVGARRAGTEVWAIGLGADSDGTALLTRATGDGERVFDASSGADLTFAFSALFTRAVCR